jgi:hypothetical protein
LTPVYKPQQGLLNKVSDKNLQNFLITVDTFLTLLSNYLPSIGTVKTVSSLRSITFCIGAPNSGNPLAVSVVSTTQTIPFACSIIGWSIQLGQNDSGTITIEVWKIAAGTAIPTIANLINTSGVSLTTGTVEQSSTVTDFTTTSIAIGDIMIAVITAITGTINSVTFQLNVQ